MRSFLLIIFLCLFWILKSEGSEAILKKPFRVNLTPSSKLWVDETGGLSVEDISKKKLKTFWEIKII